MAGCCVRRLAWWFLTLTAVSVVVAERLKEHAVKSPLCTTDVNPLKKVCYMYESTEMQQPTALQACQSKGGTLAALDTAQTLDFVKARLPASISSSFWIGYNKDNTEWYDGSVFSWTTWFPGEPNKGYERCLHSHTTNFRFYDNVCPNLHSSLCQLPEVDTQAYAMVEEKTPAAGTWSPPRSERSAESKFRCGQYCLQDPLCGKLNFHPTTLRCALYDMGAVVTEADGSQTFTL